MDRAESGYDGRIQFLFFRFGLCGHFAQYFGDDFAQGFPGAGFEEVDALLLGVVVATQS